MPRHHSRPHSARSAACFCRAAADWPDEIQMSDSEGNTMHCRTRWGRTINELSHGGCLQLYCGFRARLCAQCGRGRTGPESCGWPGVVGRQHSRRPHSGRECSCVIGERQTCRNGQEPCTHRIKCWCEGQTQLAIQPKSKAEALTAAGRQRLALPLWWPRRPHRLPVAQEPFLRLVRLSERILVDCIAVWLRLA
jgi:hypothetical protein